MLVLQGTVGDSFYVGETRVTLIEDRGGRIKVGFEGPREVPIDRAKIRDARRRNPGQQDRKAA